MMLELVKRSRPRFPNRPRYGQDVRIYVTFSGNQRFDSGARHLEHRLLRLGGIEAQAIVPDSRKHDGWLDRHLVKPTLAIIVPRPNTEDHATWFKFFTQHKISTLVLRNTDDESLKIYGSQSAAINCHDEEFLPLLDQHIWPLVRK